MKEFRLIVILLFATYSLCAQNWKRTRQEVSAGVGISNFLGDLGGGLEDGTNGLKDFNLGATRYAFNLSYRYLLKSNLAAKGSFTYAKISGDDSHSDNPIRNVRNLKFRAPIFELSMQAEYYFLREKSRGIYRLKKPRGFGKLKMDGYLFGGVGVTYFNPKNEVDGEWHALQPLGTEGQGIAGGPGDKYSRVAAVFPIGFGFKKSINKRYSIGLECGMRVTSTDYLDDASGTYFENHLIEAEYGEIAAQLAHPTTDPINFPDVTYNADGTVVERQQRGNPNNNDTYMFAIVSVHYKLKKRRRNLPKF